MIGKSSWNGYRVEKEGPMSQQKCTICGRPQIAEFQPFCSNRCTNVDLQRWFGGRYRVPTDEEPDPGEPISFDPEHSR